MTSCTVPSYLEKLCDRCMPGTARRRLGDWTLRSHLGATGRANSTWPSGDPGTTIDRAVDEVIDWYRGIGMRPRFQIFDGSSAALSTELDRRGWLTGTGAEIMSAEIVEPQLPDRTRPDDLLTRVATRPDSAFADLVGNPDRLAELTMSRLGQTFVTTTGPDGTLLGGAMSMRDSDWLGVFAMKTRPEARRTGVGSHLLGVLAEAGRARGASGLWLQVRPDNAPARRFYERAGLARVHRYHYRFPDR